MAEGIHRPFECGLVLGGCPDVPPPIFRSIVRDDHSVGFSRNGKMSHSQRSGFANTQVKNRRRTPRNQSCEAGSRHAEWVGSSVFVTIDKLELKRRDSRGLGLMFRPSGIASIPLYTGFRALCLLGSVPSGSRHGPMAGGPALILNLGCPILDDFQGWGFRPAFLRQGSCSIRRVQPRQSMHVKVPTLQERKDGAPKLQNLRQRPSHPSWGIYESTEHREPCGGQPGLLSF